MFGDELTARSCWMCSRSCSGFIWVMSTPISWRSGASSSEVTSVGDDSLEFIGGGWSVVVEVKVASFGGDTSEEALCHAVEETFFWTDVFEVADVGVGDVGGQAREVANRVETGVG